MQEKTKNYERKTFVIGIETIEKLKKIAQEKNRKLNWVVNEILKEYCAK
jgi:hypothetical protein